MKTPRSEILRRKKEYLKTYKKYENINYHLHTLLKDSIDDPEAMRKFNDILDSPEYQELENSLLYGPIYDLSKEDLEDDRYENTQGEHPLHDETFKNLYQGGEIYGKPLKDLGVIECLAYDYNNQYYYKLKSPDKNGDIYVPVCNK